MMYQWMLGLAHHLRRQSQSLLLTYDLTAAALAGPIAWWSLCWLWYPLWETHRIISYVFIWNSRALLISVFVLLHWQCLRKCPPPCLIWLVHSINEWFINICSHQFGLLTLYRVQHDWVKRLARENSLKKRVGDLPRRSWLGFLLLRYVYGSGLVKSLNLRLSSLLCFLWAEFKQSLAKCLTHLYQIIHGEMAILVAPLRRPTEATLECIWVLYTELLPDNHSASRFLTFMSSEQTPMIREVFTILIQQPWKHFFLCRQTI